MTSEDESAEGRVKMAKREMFVPETKATTMEPTFLSEREGEGR